MSSAPAAVWVSSISALISIASLSFTVYTSQIARRGILDAFALVGENNIEITVRNTNGYVVRLVDITLHERARVKFRRPVDIRQIHLKGRDLPCWLKPEAEAVFAADARKLLAGPDMRVLVFTEAGRVDVFGRPKTTKAKLMITSAHHVQK